MKVDTVEFAKGYRKAHLLDAKVAFQELEKIRKAAKGDLSPDKIVAAASSPKNPLHVLFTWDDTKAAKEFRKDEARLLARSVIVTFKESPKIPVRAYHIVTIKESERKASESVRVYNSTEDILADPTLRAELLSQALRELVAYQKRFRGLQELVPIFRALDEVLTTMETPALVNA